MFDFFKGKKTSTSKSALFQDQNVNVLCVTCYSSSQFANHSNKSFFQYQGSQNI